MNDRFFLDHGMWHDRLTGQHMYTEDQYYEKYREGLAYGKEDVLAGLIPGNWKALALRQYVSSDGNVIFAYDKEVIDAMLKGR